MNAIRDIVRSLLDSQQLAALATCDQDQPYASLVAFACTPDLKRLFFATPRHGRKYHNLIANARVALLMDNCRNEPADFNDAAAVTAIGRAEWVDPQRHPEWIALFIARHPSLADFAQNPDSALFAVEVETYRCVQRFQETTEFSPE